MNTFERLFNFIKTISVQTLSICLVLILVTTSAIAQEKESLKIKSTTIEYHINKNTKDNELDEIKKEVNDQKVANLSFSNIKRNDKGEIISLKTQFKDERGSSQQKSEYNSNGISDFTVKIQENEAGYRYLELGSPSNQNRSYLNTANDPQSGRGLYSEQSDKELEEFFAQDFMQLMQSMQQDMKTQQEAFIKLMEAHQKTTTKEKKEESLEK
ncbi:hypothetical protein LNQ81_14730 [Myroides sp. M-43]|uniref:hypothetical protein n=1 Tax=Myroides oncorhynchi TaxID=2893756 RepID=UPI001E611106|nr:hypothetical protein [Myroides oncorhynchi]MCC9043932.1 hypothetical protein [Myroides oncorhynchi]